MLFAKRLNVPGGSKMASSSRKTTFLQVNLGRGKAARNLCLQTGAEHQADFLLLTKPYGRQVSTEWYEDANGRAAIMIANPTARVRSPMESDSGFVSVDLNGVGIYSCYFSPNDRREEFEKELSELKSKVQTVGSEVIITGDFNVKSPL